MERIREMNQEYRKERLLYAIFLLLAVVGFLYAWNQNSALNARISTLEDENTRLQTSVDSLNNLDRELLPVTRIVPITELEWRRFAEVGLGDVQSEFIRDLDLNRDVILNNIDSEMSNPTVDAIYLLSNQWVMANFRDGENQISALLKFRVNREGEVFWELIEYHNVRG